MNYNVEHIDELIGKYLAGEAEEGEIHFIEAWSKESDANEKYFNHCKLIFEKTVGSKALQEFDVDAAWIKMKAKLHPESRTVALPTQKHSQLFWRIAASIVVVFGIGFFAYRWMNPAGIKSWGVVSQKETKADTLPDGSGVFLNKKTELSYSYDKNKKSHKVRLKGEAYFNIQHEDDKTFIIDVDGVFVRDIGTSFNVKAYPEDNTVEVVVVEGKVMFYTDKDSGIYLSANGKGIYNKTTKKFTIEQPEENILAYKTKFFSFSDTDLRTAVQALNNVYDKKIVISENLNNCHLTVSFNNEDIDEIASVMAETLGLTVTHTDSSIRLEGAGCEN
ncbi:FecR family protein [Chryseolinea sp. H1M3-3]|uniref:FecR family protein n=1 Tax=Chryseolinea sp. H1M3-3 TaxID=3034144 RepID=UPI0023EC1F77|nr:FecR family protein [Chryseolinea sp. H1M3-3]